MTLGLYFVIHFICAALAAGIVAGDIIYGRKLSTVDRKKILGPAWFMGLILGPVMLVISFFISGFIAEGFTNPFRFKGDY